MQFLGAAQTRERLPFAPLIDALRTMFAQGCELPPRQILELAAPGAEPVTSLVMPAWQSGGCYGVKVVNIAPANAARGLPGLHSTYVLYDATTGVSLAWRVLATEAIGTLAELARGRRSGRTSMAGRTVFKSVGSALEELAAAMLVHRATPEGR